MQLVAVFLPSLIWLADLLTRLLTGFFLTRWTHYMFRPDIPLVIRILSWWLVLMMLCYPVCVYLPSHLVLQQVYRKKRPLRAR
jgi:hypothetical protein